MPKVQRLNSSQLVHTCLECSSRLRDYTISSSTTRLLHLIAQTKHEIPEIWQRFQAILENPEWRSLPFLSLSFNNRCSYPAKCQMLAFGTYFCHFLNAISPSLIRLSWCILRPLYAVYAVHPTWAIIISYPPSETVVIMRHHEHLRIEWWILKVGHGY